MKKWGLSCRPSEPCRTSEPCGLQLAHKGCRFQLALLWLHRCPPRHSMHNAAYSWRAPSPLAPLGPRSCRVVSLGSFQQQCPYASAQIHQCARRRGRNRQMARPFDWHGVYRMSHNGLATACQSVSLRTNDAGILQVFYKYFIGMLQIFCYFLTYNYCIYF